TSASTPATATTSRPASPARRCTRARSTCRTRCSSASADFSRHDGPHPTVRAVVVSAPMLGPDLLSQPRNRGEQWRSRRPSQASTPGRGARSSSAAAGTARSEEHTSELQSREKLVCRLLLEKKKRQVQPAL